MQICVWIPFCFNFLCCFSLPVLVFMVLKKALRPDSSSLSIILSSSSFLIIPPPSSSSLSTSLLHLLPPPSLSLFLFLFLPFLRYTQTYILRLFFLFCVLFFPYKVIISPSDFYNKLDLDFFFFNQGRGLKDNTFPQYMHVYVLIPGTCVCYFI